MFYSSTKKLLLCLLLIGFVFQAGMVLALEINYPSIPGAETPQQIQSHLKEEERLPLYINYFLRLFFILTIGIAAGVIFFGGVAYLIPGAQGKPAAIAAANARIKQGLLGLGIIVASYLVLAVINPQLLIFKTIIPEEPHEFKIVATEIIDKVTFLKVPIGALIDKFLKSLIAETPYKSYAPGESLEIKSYNYVGSSIIPITTITTIEDNDSVKKIELPVLESLALLDRAIVLNKEIVELLKNCKCGKSKYHIQRIIGADGTICVGGLGLGVGSGSCTVQMNENNTAPLLDKNGNASCANICSNKCEDCGRNTCYTATLIAKREELVSIMAKLQAQETKLNLEQIKLIIDALGNNASEFLIRESKEYNFQEDFNAQAKNLKEQGNKVILKTAKQYPETTSDIDPFIYYVPLENEPKK